MFLNRFISEIINNDTINLVNKANEIVLSCTGTNCNTSPETKRNVTVELSQLSQQQANNLARIFELSNNSILAREIYTGYINLSMNVSQQYNYGCNNTTQNNNCTLLSSNVIRSQEELRNLLEEPAEAISKHFLVIYVILIIAMILLFLFFISIIIGLIKLLFKAPKQGADAMKSLTDTLERSGYKSVVLN